MFRKTRKEKQLDLFYSPGNLLGKRALKKYDDPKAWQNIFYKEVTSRIDEGIFSVLFNAHNGAPNASVCRLVAMMLLKEGYGCSDEQLFEMCEFDLLARRALGIEGFEEDIPCAATYYNFRAALMEYNATHERDLLQECFEQVTGGQARDYGVSGRSVRMDSKLIGSNIALYSRYELVHRTLLASLEGANLSALSPELRALTEAYLGEDAAKTVYRTDSEGMKSRFLSLGEYVHTLLGVRKGMPLLERVFKDQFTVEDGVVAVRPGKEIAADSLQNPNDPDATYRRKNSQRVQGYSANITETCGEEGKPSLITGVQVETATHADSDFLQEGVSQSERVTGGTVEKVHADGAYQSPGNREFAASHLHGGDKGMELLTGKMQGEARFDLSLEGEELTVTDRRTGKTTKAEKAASRPRKGGEPTRRWRIPWAKDKGQPWKYFSEKDVAASGLRRLIESLPPDDQKMRNNVEATMFQYSLHTHNNKTRYRGLAKHRMQALARCMWVNLRRLVIFNSLSVFHHFCALWGFIWASVTSHKNYFSIFASKLWGAIWATLERHILSDNVKYSTCTPF